MRILHIIPHINEEASGPSYSVSRLCQSLSTQNNEVILSCLKANENIPGVKLEVHQALPIFKNFAISFSHASSISKQADKLDIIHNHSLWSMVNVAAGWTVPNKKSKLVSSPRGCLSTWALNQKYFSKKMLWPLQKRVLSKSNLLHATSYEEYKDIRRMGLKQPVLVIPNGIDAITRENLKEKKKKRRALFLSRIHPVKGLEILLEAWQDFKFYKDWELIIAGPGDKNYIQSLEKMVLEFNLKNVKFIGPIYGEDKISLYKNSDFLVLPTHSENFGMVVAESLSNGCPVIVSQGAPWSGIDKKRCGWWIPNNINDLKRTIKKAISLPKNDLIEMGKRGQKWMKQDFSWERVSLSMTRAYDWILNGGPKPEDIITK